MRCSASRALRTGWNVPAPTCSVRSRRLHTLGAQGVQQLRSEVQSGRRRRHGPRPRRVHRLVALHIDRTVGVPDVRRQRHVSVLLEHRKHVAVEAQHEEIVASALDDRRRRHRGTRNVLPVAGLWLVRTSASARVGSSTRSTSASTLPPLGFLPCSRALITRVSLNTSRSSRSSSPTRSPKRRSCRPPVATCSSRLAARSGNGCCAISSVGSSKSKSASVNSRSAMAGPAMRSFWRAMRASQLRCARPPGRPVGARLISSPRVHVRPKVAYTSGAFDWCRERESNPYGIATAGF